MTARSFNYTTDSELSLFYSRDKQIAETLVITVPNHETSISCANRAIDSCIRVGQPNPRIFWGYDGTDKKIIKTPEHLQNNIAMQLLKVMDTGLSITEVACFLSHIAAWVHCIKIDKPIVILEHDSVMLHPYTEKLISNSLEYLGHIGEVAKQVNISNMLVLKHYLESGEYSKTAANRYLDVPLTQFININYLLILGLHNYAIDPIIARKLYSYVLKYGLINPADAIIEQHEFCLVQTGVFAAQSPDAEFTSSIDSGISGDRKYTYSIPGVTNENSID